MRIPLFAATVLLVSFAARCAFGENLRVAVATNFVGTVEELRTEFESQSGHAVAIISGSTGQLYAQIRNGAPFDVLLAADQERPRLLASEGLGDPASVSTYAIGRLALWSKRPGFVTEQTLAQLPDTEFRWLAIAEPAIAPYGLAARQTLEYLDAWQSLQSRIVKGQNVAQAFAMIDTGNADLGFVALSQVLMRNGESSFVLVPQSAHELIRQDEIVLNAGMKTPAAAAFVAFLKSHQAAAIIRRNGYEIPPSAQ